MAISLGFWEWGCPKRGDAHITVTAQCPSHVKRDTRQVKTAVESLYTKEPILTSGASFILCPFSYLLIGLFVVPTPYLMPFP